MTTFLKLQADKQGLKRKTPSSERTSTAENNSSASPSSDSLSDSIEDESGDTEIVEESEEEKTGMFEHILFDKSAMYLLWCKIFFGLTFFKPGDHGWLLGILINVFHCLKFLLLSVTIPRK